MSISGQVRGGIAPNARQDPEWLIIGGAPRSGTTLLYNLLKKNPYLALKNERNLFEQSLRDGEQRAAADYDHLLTQAQRARVVYLGEKRPEYYEFPLSRCFPSGRVSFLHVSRRPRDVIGSMLARTERARRGDDPGWSPYFTARDAADTWLRAWQFAMASSGNKRFMHLKFEELVNDPDGLLRFVCEWLGVSAHAIEPGQVRKPQEYPALPVADGLALAGLREIDQDWDKPLSRLEQTYRKLGPGWFQKPRRLRRRLLWWYSAGRKRL
ncbi:MAG: sulfotransferase family protein [Wenzhouxiangella sp.]